MIRNTTRETAHVSSTYTWPYQDTYKSIGRVPDNIDELLRDCGYATYMQYTAEGSGTMSYMAGVALTRTFGYPEECVKYQHYAYSMNPVEWMQTIYDELAAKCPILYGSDDESFGGHAFLFTGVDADGLVYVNWGWRGTADGFYDIGALTPTQHDQTMNFNGTPEMIYGIRPQPLPADHIVARIYGYSGNPYTFRFGTEKDGNDVEHQTLYCDLLYGFVNFNASGFQGVFGIYAEDLTDGSSWVIAPDLQDRDTIPCGSGYAGSSEQYKDFYFYYFIDGATGLKPGHDYRMSFGVKDDREGVWRSLLCAEGEVAYDIHYTGDITTSTISEERVPAPVMNAIGDIAATPALSDNHVRVYDLQGRQVYAAPASSFNLWDVPARGVLVVRQNGTTRKVVR